MSNKPVQDEINRFLSLSENLNLTSKSNKIRYINITAKVESEVEFIDTSVEHIYATRNKTSKVISRYVNESNDFGIGTLDKMIIRMSVF